MNIGLDVGYSHTKAVAGERRASFPSVTGSPDRPTFSLNGNEAILLVSPGPVLVGQEAVEQSRFVARREDRRWVQSDEWYTLALAALSEMTAATAVDVNMVTGLPASFYQGDKDIVRDRLLGAHKLQREGRRAQTFTCLSCRVIPQPFGAVLALCLDDRGRIVDNDIATGHVGLVDVGGKTTNILSVRKLREVGRETASVSVGAWDVVRAVRAWLGEHCPDLDLRDHQVIEAVIARQARYFGQPVDLSQAVDSAVEPMAEQVIAAASQLWNGGAALDAILVSGGGALLVGPYVRRHFRHARVLGEPVFANALGFWRYARRMAGQ